MSDGCSLDRRFLFLEPHQGEVPRILVPRTRVNKLLDDVPTSLSDHHHRAWCVPDDRVRDASHQSPPYPPRPLLPITIRPTPTSSARWTISHATSPITRWDCATVPPADLTRLTSPSSTSIACRWRSSSRIASGTFTPFGSVASG